MKLSTEKMFFGIFCIAFGVIVSVESLRADSGRTLLPDWFIPLREAVYEQRLSSAGILPVYREAVARAEDSLEGADRYIMLSRCEYMMGRVYQYEERKAEAAVRYEAGMDWAEKALELIGRTEAWQMLAENLSQACAVKSVSYAMANGLKVEKYAKEALALDSQNAAAQIMLAARWVYAPAPFNNFKRGIAMMEDVVNNPRWNVQRDDRFNACSAIGYAYVQQKKYVEAKSWLEAALAVYPTNKYVRTLLEKQ
ncbi:MAG: tetratricopeptide repeat protein [Spirochaetaceae bacterium]|jgi:tetratricopeptide (TPR) repeat protein|nr:tetratricopeptide repeat protein [Spirochaetaceae bacterium]